MVKDKVGRKDKVRGLKEGMTIKFDELVSISENKKVSYVGKFIGIEEERVGATKSTKVYLKIIGYNNIRSEVKMYKIDVMRLYDISSSRLVGDKGKEVLAKYNLYLGDKKEITLKEYMFRYLKSKFKGNLEDVYEDSGELVVRVLSRDLNKGLKYVPEILYTDDSARYNIPKGLTYSDISLLNMRAILGYEPVNFTKEDLKGLGDCRTDVLIVPIDTKGDYCFEVRYRFKLKDLKVGNRGDEISKLCGEIVRIIKTNDNKGRESRYNKVYKKYMANKE